MNGLEKPKKSPSSNDLQNSSEPLDSLPQTEVSPSPISSTFQEEVDSFQSKLNKEHFFSIPTSPNLEKTLSKKEIGEALAPLIFRQSYETFQQKEQLLLDFYREIKQYKEEQPTSSFTPFFSQGLQNNSSIFFNISSQLTEQQLSTESLSADW